MPTTTALAAEGPRFLGVEPKPKARRFLRTHRGTASAAQRRPLVAVVGDANLEADRVEDKAQKKKAAYEVSTFSHVYA